MVKHADEAESNEVSDSDDDDIDTRHKLVVNSTCIAVKRAARYRKRMIRSALGSKDDEDSVFLTKADKQTDIRLSCGVHQRNFVYLPVPHEQRGVNPRELFLIFQRYSSLVHKDLLQADWERKHTWDHLRVQLEEEFGLLYPELPHVSRKNKRPEEFEKLKAEYLATLKRIKKEKAFLREQFEKTMESDMRVCSASKRNMSNEQFIKCCIEELELPIKPGEARSIYQNMNQGRILGSGHHGAGAHRSAEFHYQEFRFALGLVLEVVHDEDGQRYKELSEFGEMLDVAEVRDRITWAVSALLQSRKFEKEKFLKMRHAMIERGVLVKCQVRGAGILTDIFTDRRREVIYVTGQKEIMSDDAFDEHRKWTPKVLYPGEFVLHRQLQLGEIEEPPVKGTKVVHSIRGHGVVNAVLPKGDRVIQFKDGTEEVYPQHCWGENKPSQLNASDRGVLRKWSKTSQAVVDETNSLENRMLRLNVKIFSTKQKTQTRNEKQRLLQRSLRGGGESKCVEQCYTSNGSPSEHMNMSWPDDALPPPRWTENGISSQGHLPAQQKLKAAETKLTYSIEHQTTPEKLLALVESHIRRCKFVDAIDVAGQALEVLEKGKHRDKMLKAKILYYTGKAQMQLGELEVCLSAFEKATTLNPSYSEAWAAWSTAIVRRTKPLIAETRTELDKANEAAKDITEKLDAFKEQPPSPMTEEWENELKLFEKKAKKVVGYQKSMADALNKLKADLRKANQYSGRAVCIKGRGVC